MANFAAQNLIGLGERTNEQRLANLEMNALYGPTNQTTFPDVEERAGMTLVYDDQGHPALQDLNPVIDGVETLEGQLTGNKLYHAANSPDPAYVCADFSAGAASAIDFPNGAAFGAGGNVSMALGLGVLGVITANAGFQVKSANGSYWNVTVSNAGTLVITAV